MANSRVQGCLLMTMWMLVLTLPSNITAASPSAVAVTLQLPPQIASAQDQKKVADSVLDLFNKQFLYWSFAGATGPAVDQPAFNLTVLKDASATWNLEVQFQSPGLLSVVGRTPLVLPGETVQLHQPISKLLTDRIAPYLQQKILKPDGSEIQAKFLCVYAPICLELKKVDRGEDFAAIPLQRDSLREIADSTFRIQCRQPSGMAVYLHSHAAGCLCVYDGHQKGLLLQHLKWEVTGRDKPDDIKQHLSEIAGLIDPSVRIEDIRFFHAIDPTAPVATTQSSSNPRANYFP